MLWKFAGHRANDGKIINHRTDVREKFTYRNSAFPIRLKFPKTRQQISNTIELSSVDFKKISRIFSSVTIQTRFWIETIDLGYSAVHIEKNNALGTCCMVYSTSCFAVHASLQTRFSKKGSGRNRSKPASRSTKPLSTSGKRCKPAAVMLTFGGEMRCTQLWLSP